MAQLGSRAHAPHEHIMAHMNGFIESLNGGAWLESEMKKRITQPISSHVRSAAQRMRSFSRDCMRFGQQQQPRQEQHGRPFDPKVQQHSQVRKTRTSPWKAATQYGHKKTPDHELRVLIIEKNRP